MTTPTTPRPEAWVPSDDDHDPHNSSSGSLGSLGGSDDDPHNSSSGSLGSLGGSDDDHDPHNSSSGSLGSLGGGDDDHDPHNSSWINNMCTGKGTSDPLYSGAPISRETSCFSIYWFAASNHLTDKATQELLDLISLHCPTPNSGPRSLYQLKKCLSAADNCIYSQYCSKCMKEIPLEDNTAIHQHARIFLSCATLLFSPLKIVLKKFLQVSYFVCCIKYSYTYQSTPIYINFVSAENWDLVQYPFSRATNAGCLQDIHDTKKYQRLSQAGKFLSVPEHTGLILSTDGVPLFKSSGKLLINNIIITITTLLHIHIPCFNRAIDMASTAVHYEPSSRHQNECEIPPRCCVAGSC